MSLVVEPEVLNGRRAFAKAQALLAGEPIKKLPSNITIGWHDTATHPESGCFAVVGMNAGRDDWIGEVVLVEANGRACYVYVMASADVPVELSLARRAFASLSALSAESVEALARVIG